MKNQNLFRLLLIAQTLALVVYTFFAFQSEGAGLFNIFLANLESLTWNGQFNLDFSCYLLLSALWIMWRNKFSIGSIVIAIAAAIIGIMVFAPYLLYLLQVENGNLKKVLVGER